MSAIAQLFYPNKTIVVFAKLYFYGNFATEEIGKKIVDEIMEQYNAPHGKLILGDDFFDIKFDITYQVISNLKALDIASSNNDYKNNFIRIEQKNIVERSFMGFGLGDNAGHWLISDNLGESTTAPHEFGHALGLDHPQEIDLRGINYFPPIMAPRGTLVDFEYQWNPTVAAGEFGGTMKPVYRRVSAHEIELIFRGKTFKDSNYMYLGKISNNLFDEIGNVIRTVA